MQRSTASTTSGTASTEGSIGSGEPDQYAGGHLAFTWVTALISAWFFLPAHSWQIALPAMCCGLLSVSCAFLASRTPTSGAVRLAAIIFGALPFTLVPVVRESLSGESWRMVVVTAAVSLVTIGIMFVAIDALKQERAASRWMRALGFSSLVLAAFVGVMAGALFEYADDGWLYIHVLAAPAFVVFFWYLAARITHLRWLFTAIMLGVALPVVAMMNMASFVFLGGMGFVMYVVLQTAFVFVSERFLRTV